jgi:hypothetical protein
VGSGEKERWNSLAAPGKGKQYVPPIHFAILPPDPCMRRYVSSTSLSLSHSLTTLQISLLEEGNKRERSTGKAIKKASRSGNDSVVALN